MNYYVYLVKVEFLWFFQIDDVALSQETSIQALNAMQAIQQQSSIELSRDSPDINGHQKSGNVTKANAYLGLYSDEHTSSLLSQQIEDIEHVNDQADSHNGARDIPSRGSDIVGESQSVAGESASNDYGAEGFVEDEF